MQLTQTNTMQYSTHLYSKHTLNHYISHYTHIYKSHSIFASKLIGHVNILHFPANKPTNANETNILTHPRNGQPIELYIVLAQPLFRRLAD